MDRIAYDRSDQGNVLAGQDQPELHVYIHWPFCRSKCPYCDFNSSVADGIDHDRWRAAFVRELTGFAASTADRTVRTIYLGGGTPSLLPPALVAEVVDTIAACWSLAPDMEITLEVNPTGAETGLFRDFRAAGVNRLSIGVQAMSDADLRFLGRTHSVADNNAAISMAHATFSRVSMDLICGLPDQSIADWRRQLMAALAVAGEHLSIYQLTIEPDTPFFRRGVRAADEDTGAALWEATADLLDRAGFTGYEISNYARPAGRCGHNLAIWQGADYLGVGPGAHGRLTAADGVFAISGIREPIAWLHAVESRGSGILQRTLLTPRDRAVELVLMGLRVSDGIDARRFHALVGSSVEDIVNPAALAMLVELGDLTSDRHGIRATPQGRLRLNAVLAALLC